jgi:hypothetical protein
MQAINLTLQETADKLGVSFEKQFINVIIQFTITIS